MWRGMRGGGDGLLREPVRRLAGLPDRPFSADRSTSVSVLSFSRAIREPENVRGSSRLGAFNSRLGLRKFPVRSAKGIRTQRYDLPNLLCRQTAVTGRKGTKFPLLREKPGMLHAIGATGHSP